MDDKPQQKIKRINTTTSESLINSKIEKMNEEGYELDEFKSIDDYRVAMVFTKTPKQKPQSDVPTLTTGQRELLEDILQSVDEDEHNDAVFEKLKGKLMRGLVYD